MSSAVPMQLARSGRREKTTEVMEKNELQLYTTELFVELNREGERRKGEKMERVRGEEGRSWYSFYSLSLCSGSLFAASFFRLNRSHGTQKGKIQREGYERLLIRRKKRER